MEGNVDKIFTGFHRKAKEMSGTCMYYEFNKKTVYYTHKYIHPCTDGQTPDIQQ